MNIERLRKIIAYSDANRGDISFHIKSFCAFVGVEYDADLVNFAQIARSAVQKKGFLMLEMPLNDGEIGALCYKSDGIGYVVINTSLPRVNADFAMAHEIYHVFFQEKGFAARVEFSDDHNYEYEEEYAANLFAGMLLMPELSFRRMYLKFREESSENEIDTLVRLMSYYRVPYMAALIRCLELKLLPGNTVTEALLCADRTRIIKRMDDLWLDSSLLKASRKDDFRQIEAIVEQEGKEHAAEGYINERTLKKILSNMREIYEKVRRE